MGRVQKGCGKGISAACSEENNDSDGDHVVPSDFAEDTFFQVSRVLSYLVAFC